MFIQIEQDKFVNFERVDAIEIVNLEHLPGRKRGYVLRFWTGDLYWETDTVFSSREAAEEYLKNILEGRYELLPHKSLGHRD